MARGSVLAESKIAITDGPQYISDALENPARGSGVSGEDQGLEEDPVNVGCTIAAPSLSGPCRPNLTHWHQEVRREDHIHCLWIRMFRNTDRPKRVGQ